MNRLLLKKVAHGKTFEINISVLSVIFLAYAKSDVGAKNESKISSFTKEIDMFIVRYSNFLQIFFTKILICIVGIISEIQIPELYLKRLRQPFKFNSGIPNR